MKTKEEYIKLIRNKIPILKEKYEVTGLTLFGSVARGDNKEDSDIDLLVEMPPKLFQVCALNDYFEELLNVKVDLIRKHSHMSNRFLREVNKDGIAIF